ncbi:MAG: hypothetical protein J0J01_25160 [Reyranella sp.]|uniref:hypothetical protein n=1 Tax=Reyranella sp. TaxID=1929291 RepID=UPI001AC68A99|nr:hypothetical protein [Reyranella sp.]MBN9090214.1 hypothetical protein [Reyranella sp.]
MPYQLTNADLSDAMKLTANFNALAKCISARNNPTNSIQINGGGGTLAGISPLTNGQLVIGSSGNPPQPQGLAAGDGIQITNGAGSIAIAATSAVGGTGLYRQMMSDTPTASITGLTSWLNQGSAAVSDSTVGVCIDAPTSGTSTNLTGRFKASPSTPYTVTALVAATRYSNTLNGVGIGWYDGSAKLHLLSYQINNGAPYLAVNKWTNVTTFSATDVTSAMNAFAQPIWLQVSDDGTNAAFRFSQDGLNFVQLFSVAKSSGFLGAIGYSNVIFFADPRGSRTLATILSWTQT